MTIGKKNISARAFSFNAGETGKVLGPSVKLDSNTGTGTSTGPLGVISRGICETRQRNFSERSPCKKRVGIVPEPSPRTALELRTGDQHTFEAFSVPFAGGPRSESPADPKLFPAVPVGLLQQLLQRCTLKLKSERNQHQYSVRKSLPEEFIRLDNFAVATDGQACVLV